MHDVTPANRKRRLPLEPQPSPGSPGHRSPTSPQPKRAGGYFCVALSRSQQLLLISEQNASASFPPNIQIFSILLMIYGHFFHPVSKPTAPMAPTSRHHCHLLHRFFQCRTALREQQQLLASKSPACFLSPGTFLEQLEGKYSIL